MNIKKIIDVVKSAKFVVPAIGAGIVVAAVVAAAKQDKKKVLEITSPVADVEISA